MARSGDHFAGGMVLMAEVKIGSGEFLVDEQAMTAVLKQNKWKLLKHRVGVILNAFGLEVLTGAAIAGWLVGNYYYFNVGAWAGHWTLVALTTALMSAVTGAAASALVFATVGIFHEVWTKFLSPRLDYIRTNWTPDKLTNRLSRR